MGEKPEARSMPFLCGKKGQADCETTTNASPIKNYRFRVEVSKSFNHISNRKTALLTYKAFW
jgi:hypothetical protein